MNLSPLFSRSLVGTSRRVLELSNTRGTIFAAARCSLSLDGSDDTREKEKKYEIERESIFYTKHFCTRKEVRATTAVLQVSHVAI